MTQPLFSGRSKGEVVVNPQEAAPGSTFVISCNEFDVGASITISIHNAQGQPGLREPLVLTASGNGSSGSARTTFNSGSAPPGVYTVTARGRIDGKDRELTKTFSIVKD
jgi:hypothetical protein